MKRDFNKIQFSLSKDLIIPEDRKLNCARGSKRDWKTAENLTILCGRVVDAIELPIQFTWSFDDVLKWLGQIGFPQYQNTFKTNFINGRRLLLVDAETLIKMNIHDFDHIKTIAGEIRRMFNVELQSFFRSISLPPRQPDTHFKLFKIPTGLMRELCLRTEFFRQVNLLGKAEIPLNHFEKLHKWLQHIPAFQSVRIGGTKRINLYFVKPNMCRDLEPFIEKSTCKCTMPPCDCSWSKSQKRQPWRLSFLVQVDEGKYSKSVCANQNEITFINQDEITLILMSDEDDDNKID